MGEDLINRIITESSKLFHRYGIKAITMDEIARNLAISKKTLYQFYPNKDELVHQVGLFHVEQDRKRWCNNPFPAESALEQMVMVTVCMRQEFAEMNPALIYDLRRNHPRTWALFESQKNDIFAGVIRDNIIRGMKEGHYRPDLNVEVMVTLRMELLEMGMNPDIFSPEKFNLQQVQMEMLEHFVRGLLSEKGLQRWLAIKNDNTLLETIENQINIF